MSLSPPSQATSVSVTSMTSGAAGIGASTMLAPFPPFRVCDRGAPALTAPAGG